MIVPGGVTGGQLHLLLLTTAVTISSCVGRREVVERSGPISTWTARWEGAVGEP
eukprot:COSAG02_NODE_44808_length_362_cov_9.634981_1_plen_53_part_10